MRLLYVSLLLIVIASLVGLEIFTTRLSREAATAARVGDSVR
jgi:hypothetical protein